VTTVPAAQGRARGRLFGCLLLALLGLTIAAGVAVPLYYLPQWQSQPGAAPSDGSEQPAEHYARHEQIDETAVQEPALGAPPPLGGPPQGVTWTNAAEDAIASGAARVRIVRVEYGEVLARDERHHPISAGPGDFLKIYLEIENRADAPLRYVSWYGNHFAAAGKKVMARLWDDSGKPYPQQTFDRPRGIQGHTPESTLSSRDRVGDVLIFALPKSIAERPDHSFRLELPGGAVRGRSFYRFRIPGSMLSKF
jgi:hypothetical protein